MTLVSKFLLIFILAKFLEPSELGLYGLVVATIGYALYLLGIDFYTYVTREVVVRDRQELGALLKNQATLTLVLYLLFIPLISLIFVAGILPWYLICWFFILLVLEHLNQELMRLLIAISQPLAASAALFLRSGAWALVLVAAMYLVPEMRNLESALMAWSLGSGAALILAIWRLSKTAMGGWRTAVDWVWIRQGIKIALPFLLATLAIRGVYTLDRYWLDAIAGLEVVGAYVLFIGIATAMMSFLDAGVFAFSYPALIRAFQQHEPQVFRGELIKLFFHTFSLSLVFVLGALLLIDPLLGWLNRPVYFQNKAMFPWVLLATFLSALGMVPHYGLYAQNQDRPIIQSHVSSVVVFLLATWFFSQWWPLSAIPIGLCIAFLSVALWKFYAFFKLTPARFYSHQL